MDAQKLIEEVKAMSVMELNDLVKAFEEKFGVSAAAMASVANTEPVTTVPASSGKEAFLSRPIPEAWPGKKRIPAAPGKKTRLALHLFRMRTLLFRPQAQILGNQIGIPRG